MSSNKLIIYGNGQMARMFLHFAQCEFEVVAFTVDRHVITDKFIEGIPVVPFDEIQNRYPPTDHEMIVAVGYLEMNRLRARKHEEGRNKGYRFSNYIHPSVVRHSALQIGENNVILDHVAIHPYVRLGSGIFICSNTTIGHGCTVSDYCWINSGVSIGGETLLGEGCFLGINATVADNIEMGRHNYIGANTLILRDTQPENVFISAAGEKFPLTSDAFLKFISRTSA
ncbi:MAG: hypothetical protein E6Q34_04295 [Burkholderiaceae bacterium]|nr:MAG: hypothetical protein E6Q34_04295 [Burkholderiaceae bacterium]